MRRRASAHTLHLLCEFEDLAEHGEAEKHELQRQQIAVSVNQLHEKITNTVQPLLARFGMLRTHLRILRSKLGQRTLSSQK